MLLIVNWKSNVGDATMIQCVAASFVGKHFDLVRIDDFLIVDSHVVEQPCHVYFLLEIASFQIGVCLPG